MFGILKDWFERRAALRELRANDIPDSKPYSAWFREQIGLAMAEFSQQRPRKALEIWRRMYAQYSDLCLQSEQGLNLFVDLCLHDEAEALIQEGRRRYPRNASLYEAALARVAYRRGDLEQALTRYAAVRRQFPRVADGYGIAAACLSALGRGEEAEAMLNQGVRKLTNNYDLCMRYAQAAVQRRDWNAGLDRWKIVTARFPYLTGPLGIAQCLREMGRLDEAEAVLTGACEQFGSNPYPFSELAVLAMTRGDVTEAIRRWEVVVNLFPWFDRAYTESAAILQQVGRDADADERLRLVVGRSPEFLPGHLAFARSAQRRADWSEAAERWALVKKRFPDCSEAVDGERLALEAVRLQPDRSAPPIQ